MALPKTKLLIKIGFHGSKRVARDQGAWKKSVDGDNINSNIKSRALLLFIVIEEYGVLPQNTGFTGTKSKL